MRKVIILYTQFLDFEGNEEKIGGIETYIKNLIDVSLNIGLEVNIIQFSNVNFKKSYKNDVFIYGVKDEKKVKSKKLIEKAYEIGNCDNDILIFASSHMNRKNKFKQSIAIQHGIYWDLNTVKGKKVNKLFTTLLKSMQIYIETKRNSCVNKVVCVDYNYINWYRALTKITSERLVCIPNFTLIKNHFLKRKNKYTKIIFARRFEYIRGVEIISEAIEKLIDDGKGFELTFAGSGTYEEKLKQKFADNSNIKFITYKSEDSIKIHMDYDIAVVPSIGSEGTSLSLLEAMSAGCCVIATNVGGMTNIIIDGFNGIISETNANSLYLNLKELINNKEKREKLAENGYQTVMEGFDIEIWKKKWEMILNEK